jgi:predicted Zn finger-like uncharacterized protein
MILSCPACGTRYLVDDDALRLPDGRTVRCASCGHTWHQLPEPPEVRGDEHTTRLEGPRIEPELGVPPRPGSSPRPTLEVPPRSRPVPGETPQRRRSRWATVRWLVLIVLFVLAILAGIVVARGAVVAWWPGAARLYALAGLPVEPLGSGLKIEKLAPARTPDGLVIEGEITNTGKTARDVPRLRVALHDAAEKEVQFKIIDPPRTQLPPGAVAHFKTPFEHPDDAATGVVVTFTTH